MTQDKIETIEVDDQPRNAEPIETPEVPSNTILRVWSEILGNLPAERARPITMQAASTVVTSVPGMTFAECDTYSNIFYDLLDEVHGVLVAELELDPEAINRVEDDADANELHYLNIILGWQSILALYNSSWRASDENAHLKVAAYSNVAAMLFGEKGMTQWLQEIGFNPDQETAESMFEAAQELEV